MSDFDAAKQAGKKLKMLIRQHYSTQEEFAVDFGADIRTINRYINCGINKVSVIQELAFFFGIDFISFFEEN